MTGGFSTMAISTPYFALLNLGRDFAPTTFLLHHCANTAELLSFNVVELQYHQVAFTTIHARMRNQVVTDSFFILLDATLLVN